jgi:hypothetical protein
VALILWSFPPFFCRLYGLACRTRPYVSLLCFFVALHGAGLRHIYPHYFSLSLFRTKLDGVFLDVAILFSFPLVALGLWIWYVHVRSMNERLAEIYLFRYY